MSQGISHRGGKIIKYSEVNEKKKKKHNIPTSSFTAKAEPIYKICIKRKLCNPEKKLKSSSETDMKKERMKIHTHSKEKQKKQ